MNSLSVKGRCGQHDHWCQCPSGSLLQGTCGQHARVEHAELRPVNVSWRKDAIIPCYQMAVYPSSDVVSSSLAFWGAWDIKHPTTMELKAGVPAGTIPPPPGLFVDMGANIGHHSLVFAKAGYSVLAFEPLRLNRIAFRTSLCANTDVRKRVMLVATALGSQTTRGPCVTFAYQKNRGNGELACGEEATCAQKCVAPACTHCENVNITTLDAALDSALAEGSAPSSSRRRKHNVAEAPVVAAKLDAEGAECDILEGGHSLLAVYRPALVQVEVAGGGRMSNRMHCVKQAAARHGYVVNYRRGEDDAYMVRRDRLKRAGE